MRSSHRNIVSKIRPNRKRRGNGHLRMHRELSQPNLHLPSTIVSLTPNITCLIYLIKECGFWLNRLLRGHTWIFSPIDHNVIQIMNVYECNGTLHLSPNFCSIVRVINIHYFFYISCRKIQKF